uniref:Secreted protein n=1 Tax=Knipowitschia caucasica TaxID=637954 RepID=A0AAV2JM12_KNICA
MLVCLECLVCLVCCCGPEHRATEITELVSVSTEEMGQEEPPLSELFPGGRPHGGVTFAAILPHHPSPISARSYILFHTASLSAPPPEGPTSCFIQRTCPGPLPCSPRCASLTPTCPTFV